MTREQRLLSEQQLETGKPTIRVKVARSALVALFYTTAVLASEDGSLRFTQDLYGHDAPLDRALSNRRSGE